MDIQLNAVKLQPVVAEVEIKNVVNRPHPNGVDFVPTAAFGVRVDNGEEVFVTGKCAQAIVPENGEIIEFSMNVNDKWQRGESNCKWFAYYAHVDEEGEAEVQLDIEDYIGTRDSTKRNTPKRYDEEYVKAARFIDAGGVWTVMGLANAILGSSYTTTSGMSAAHKNIMASLNQYLVKRHRDGTIARVEIRKAADQEKVSYVFYTAHAEMLAEALRSSK